MLTAHQDDSPQIVAAKEQMSVDLICTNDALAKLRAAVKGFSEGPETGYVAPRGKAELSVDDYIQEVQQLFAPKLQEVISAIHTGLTNDVQRKVFQRQSVKIAEAFIAALQFHAFTEYRKFKVQNLQDEIASASSTAEQRWNEPDVIDQSIRAINSAVWQISQIPGYGTQPLAVELQMRQLSSAMHIRVIKASLENNNLPYAKQYLQIYKAGMTAGDLLKMQNATDHFSPAARADSLQHTDKHSLRT